MLHRLGYFHFDQIAAWTPEEVAWVDAEPRGVHGPGRRARAGSSRRGELAEEGETPHAQDKISEE